jgi:hypothetical protein
VTLCNGFSGEIFRFKIDQHAEWLFLHSVRIGFAKKCVINWLGFPVGGKTTDRDTNTRTKINETISYRQPKTISCCNQNHSLTPIVSSPLDTISVPHFFLMVNNSTCLYYYFLKIFWAGLSVLATPLLNAYVTHFCIFERCLDSNPECCRSKQASYQLSHPSPYQYYYYFLPDFESGIRKSLSIYLPYIHVRIS